MTKRSRAEKKGNKPKLSTEAKAKIDSITNSVVPVSYTKQQRREVQQAIEKGMDTIRTQAKIKSRERDKKYKALQKQLDEHHGAADSAVEHEGGGSVLNVLIPWGLLVLSWLGFSIYFMGV